MSKPLEERFWNKVNVENNCWMWTGATRHLNGHGVMSFEKHQYPATHISLLLCGVDVPSGMMVFHSCNSSLCVNPKHLYIGTKFGMKFKNRKSAKKVPAHVRLWDKVNILDDKSCWEWTASLDGKGYGQINVNGSMKRAHRLAWEDYTKKTIPQNMCACHCCDNTLCCNPNHIFIGTQADNMKDMARKGRGRK